MSAEPVVVYVVLAHKGPEQLRRLIDRLLSDPGSRVVVHWDGDNPPALPPGVVRLPRRRIAWGGIGIPLVFVDALRAAATAHGEGWVVFLSAQDYPLRPISEVRAHLLASPFSVHMDTRLAHEGDPWQLWEPLTRYGYRHLLTPPLPAPARRYLWRLVRRSCAAVQRRADSSSAAQPWEDARPPLVLRNVGPRLSIGLRRSPRPFRARGLYAGDAWFAIRLDAARRVLDVLRTRPRYLRYMRRTLVPDECFFQSLIANELPDLEVGPWRRYREFPPGESHPRVWTQADLPFLLGLDADFARKFDPSVDAGVLDALDEVIGWG